MMPIISLVILSLGLCQAFVLDSGSQSPEFPTAAPLRPGPHVSSPSNIRTRSTPSAATRSPPSRGAPLSQTLLELSSRATGETVRSPPPPHAPRRASASRRAPPPQAPPVSSLSGTMVWCTHSVPQWTSPGPGAAPPSPPRGNMSQATRGPARPPVPWWEEDQEGQAAPPALLAPPSLWTATPASVTPSARPSALPTLALDHQPPPPPQRRHPPPPLPPPPQWPRLAAALSPAVLPPVRPACSPSPSTE